MFLNAGRCGTQWLAVGFQELYPALWVEHEPLGPAYKPRLYFRRYENPEAVLEVVAVRMHIAALESATVPYVETGWPLFSVLPLLVKHIPERLRVVHLTRHPVPSALSHLGHNTYAGSWRRDAYTRWATLGPTDRNVFQPHYAERWRRMSPYEKCLFSWTEVNLFGVEFPERFESIPFLRIRAESLLAGDRATLQQLLGFMGLPFSPEWIAHKNRKIDRMHHQTDENFDVFEVLRHPQTIAIAEKLGYDPTDLNPAELRARYRGQPIRSRTNLARRFGGRRSAAAMSLAVSLMRGRHRNAARLRRD